MHTRFDTEARVAVTQAVDIARELGHQEVGPGHLLLGLLANPRGTAYAALAEHGVHLDEAREIVAARHDDVVTDTDEVSPDDDAPGYADDREALRAIGIDLDRVREAVQANLGEDLADGWGDRAERGRGRGRRRRRHHHGHGQRHDHDSERSYGRGRRGPRSRRDDGPRFSPGLRALLRDVRRSVLRDRLDTEEAADRDSARHVPGMTGARLLLALTRCDDPAVEAVLATATGVDGLRHQAQAAVDRATA